MLLDLLFCVPSWRKDGKIELVQLILACLISVGNPLLTFQESKCLFQNSHFGIDFGINYLINFFLFVFLVAVSVVKLGTNLSDILHIYVINSIYKAFFTVLHSSCCMAFVRTNLILNYTLVIAPFSHCLISKQWPCLPVLAILISHYSLLRFQRVFCIGTI